MRPRPAKKEARRVGCFSQVFYPSFESRPGAPEASVSHWRDQQTRILCGRAVLSAAFNSSRWNFQLSLLSQSPMAKSQLRKKKSNVQLRSEKKLGPSKGGPQDRARRWKGGFGLPSAPPTSLPPIAEELGGFLDTPSKGQPLAESSMLHLWETQFQEFLKDSALEEQLLEELAPAANTRAFLVSFEQVALACRWPRREWVIRLLPALSEEAEKAFVTLADEDREDFGKVKAALLRWEAAGREKQRQEFRRFCYQEANGPREVLAQLQQLFCRWLNAEQSPKERILELLLLEQFLNVLPWEMQHWVKERGPDSCLEAVRLAEEFLRLLQEEEKQGDQQAELPLRPQMAFAKSPVKKGSKHGASSSLQAYSGFMQPIGGKKKKFQSGDYRDEKAQTQVPGKASMVFSPHRKKRSNTVLKRRYSERLRKSPLPVQLETVSATPPPPKMKRNLPSPLAQKDPKDQLKYCEECGRNFNGVASFLRHRIRHTGEKRYECCFCGKGFCWRSDLVRHEYQHTGKKPHECSYCGEGFDRKWKREEHQQIHQRSRKSL